MREYSSRFALRHIGWLALAAATAVGCGGAQTGGGTEAKGDQVATGATLYGSNCAGCHGASGEGQGDTPAVVGKSALPLDPPATAKFRKAQFHNVDDVFKFVKAAMPPKAPGSLTDEQYWAILAFDLKANGVAIEGKTLDASSAPSFVLH